MTDQAALSYDPDLLAKMREHMRTEGLDAFLVPHTDAHQSEYLPPSAERLLRLTGFSGSAGFAVVTCEHAAVFVDGRYTLQVKDEVDESRFAIQSISETPPPVWLRKQLSPGATIAYDPWLHTPSQLSAYDVLCQEWDGVLKPVTPNVIDMFWTNQPLPPASPIDVWAHPYAPLSAKAKRELIAKELNGVGAHFTVLSAGDSIAWMFNIRADDVPYTPLVLAFAVIDKTAKAKLFIDETRVSDAVREHLGDDVQILAPEVLGDTLDELSVDKARVQVSSQTTPSWIIARLTKAGAVILAGRDLCQLPKAKKSPSELDGMKRAHIRDGAALTTFLAWLSDEAPNGHVTELSAAAKLDGLRAQNDHFRGLSFPTISGAGPNGAIVHYRVNEQSNRTLKTGDLYLVDSGAQYLDGTTDVTRTVAIGAPTDEMKDRFTRVLKGHIAIATQRFPRGTRGQDLDILARQALWQAGLDYEHGTGHGVGTYLGVHEGPQGISKRGQGPELAPSMVLSNEPGYYKEGAYGIRIENLIAVVQTPTPKGGERDMFAFETLTLAPIDRALIDIGLLTPSEKDWLDAYHARVWETLHDHVDDKTRFWLKAATQPL